MDNAEMLIKIFSITFNYQIYIIRNGTKFPSTPLQQLRKKRKLGSNHANSPLFNPFLSTGFRSAGTERRVMASTDIILLRQPLYCKYSYIQKYILMAIFFMLFI